MRFTLKGARARSGAVEFVQSAEGSFPSQGARPSDRGRAPDDDVAAGVAPLRRLKHGVERAAEGGGGALRGQLVGREGEHERGARSRRGIVQHVRLRGREKGVGAGGEEGWPGWW